MNKTRIHRSQSAFTLIEMLLVVAIIGFLAAVVAGNFANKGKAAQIAATRASIAAIATACETYEVEIGHFPSSLQNLLTSSGEPNWNGPYLRGAMPVDSWATAFTYTPKDNGFEIRSAGPDKSTGSADDITN